MARNERRGRTQISVQNSSGPSVAVRGARESRPAQYNTNASLGALGAYSKAQSQKTQQTVSAIDNAANLAIQAEKKRYIRANRDNVKKAKYAALTGGELTDHLLGDPEAVDTFEQTTGELAGEDAFRQYRDEVVANYKPGSSASLRDQTDKWIEDNLGKSAEPTAFNLGAISSFMSRAQPVLEEADKRHRKAVISEQRSGLGKTIRSDITSDHPISRDWYEEKVSQAADLFPEQTDGWRRAWVLQQGMGSALRGGQGTRRAYLGMINTIPEDQRPPEVDKIIHNFQAHIDQGFSSAGDSTYQGIQSQIDTAMRSGNPEALDGLYQKALDAHRRYADDEAFRKTAGLLNKASHKMGAAAHDRNERLGLLTGNSMFYDGSMENLDENLISDASQNGLLPVISEDASNATLSAQAQRLTSVAEHLNRSSVGMRKPLQNYTAGLLTNSDNPKAQQTAVLAISSMDKATQDALLDGNPQARATFDILKDEAVTDNGSFSQRAQTITKNLPAFQEAHNIKLQDWLGDDDIKTERQAEQKILGGKGWELLSNGDESVGRQIARAAGSEGNWGGRTPALSPEVKRAYMGELRYQIGLSRVRGDGASHQQIISRAAQAMGSRIYATPTTGGSPGLIGGTLQLVGGLALSKDQANQSLVQGIAGKAGLINPNSTTPAAQQEADLRRMTTPNRVQLRLKKAPRHGEVDGRPAFTPTPFEGTDTSSADLLHDDLDQLSQGMNTDYQVVEGDYAGDNLMTVQDPDTQLPATFVSGQDNQVSGPKGTFGFAVGGTPEDTQRRFRQAADKAGLPSSVSIRPTKAPIFGGQSYEMVIGTRYPDDFQGSKKLREARRSRAADAARNNALRQARTSLQSQGRMPPSEGVTVYGREPEDYDPNGFMEHLGRSDLQHGRPGSADGPEDNSYQQRQFAFTANSEGLRHTAYQDTSGKTTVGYGFNMEAAGNKALFKRTLGATDQDWRDVKSGKRPISAQEARKLFDAHMEQDDAEVARRMDGADMSDEQRIALADVVYNAGADELDTDFVSAFKAGDWRTVGRKILFDTGTAHNAGLAARHWNQAKAAVGAHRFDALVASGDLPSYSDYQNAQASSGWADFRNHWMS